MDRPDLQPAMFCCTESADDSAFIYTCSFPGNGGLLYRPSGDDRFYELATSGCFGSWNDSYLNFSDPHHGLEGRLERRGPFVRWGDKRYRRVTVEYDAEMVVPLPDTRRIVDLMELLDGQFQLVCVHSRRYHRPSDGYSYYRLHIAKLGEPARVIVMINPGVRGNAFYAELPDGRPLWVSPHDNDSCLGSQLLVSLDPCQFEIIMNDDGTSMLMRKNEE